jgi:hypothetical protein
MPADDVTLYAVREATNYSVTYHDGTGTPRGNTYIIGEPIIVIGLIPTKTGYIFNGWLYSGTTYE